MNNATRQGRSTLTPQEFAHLGGGALAYVKAISSEDVAASASRRRRRCAPACRLFALLGADGSPIMLTDSRDAAIANAWEHELQTVSLH